MNSCSFISGSPLLASLTKGGNLPFRRLCADFGADVTISEMLYARFLVKGKPRERALLRNHESEKCFGAQLATNDPAEAVAAARIAAERGAAFIDLNCACPIEDATRRGLAAALLRKPKRIGQIAEALVREGGLPVTLKLRLGWDEEHINAREIIHIAAESGASAVALHGRTREQRYTRAADWRAINEAGEGSAIPVIGNGDILTHYEARDRKAQTCVASVMIGRGALIKPWIFQEMREQKTLDLSASERVEIYFRFASYMREHFGNDDLGKKRIMGFLPWHFSFFHRYRYLPEEKFGEISRQHPLMQTRDDEVVSDNPLELILGSPDERIHLAISEALVSAETAEDAEDRIKTITLS